ncbi:MAG: hypothetical protein DRQ44_01895 [Gammaproteobacteria bacterium]|nr:MAG: hypothetical protein DRQ44_01895 [Gammaproteobacteria bacterium]
MKQEKFNQDVEAHGNQSVFKDIAPGEIIIGVLTGINEQGQPLVNFQESISGTPVIALSTVALNQQQTGRQVALLFAEGNPEKPVIMGLIHSALDVMIENFELSVEDEVTPGEARDTTETVAKIDDVTLDGKSVVLEGKEEIVLKCGEASITLTKAGKILIRGKYLLSRSTGINRILGGSVQVN